MTRNSRTLATLIATALAAVALPAAAGSWPNLPAKKAPAKAAAIAPAAKLAAPDGFVFGAGAAAAPVNDAFEMVGGDTGWQLKQHKYQLAAGRFAHSEECDHAIRTAIGPTPAEVERVRNQSPGA